MCSSDLVLGPAEGVAWGARVMGPGAGDNAASGLGVDAGDDVVVSLGTSGTAFVRSAVSSRDISGAVAGFADATGAFLPLVCTLNAAMVLDAACTLLGVDHHRLSELALSAPAGADGLVVVPYLAGERTPNVPDGSGVLLGLNQGAFRGGPLARAAMEGVTLGMNYGLRRLADLGVRPREIRVTGGGARSAAWRQIMADVFGVPVVGMREDEGAALGGALQAAWCVALRDGRKAKLADLAAGVVALNESTRCTPNKSNVARYREIQDVQDNFSRALRGVFPAARRLAQ